MNRPQLYQLKIDWYRPGLPGTINPFDVPQRDSINRYARDESHAVSIGKKFARETLRATGEIHVTATPIKT